MNFKDITFAETEVQRASVKITDDLEVEVRNYLPIVDKGELVTWIVDRAVDENTGCFSPLRIEVYFSLAVLKWSAGIEVDTEDVATAYDAFEQTGVFNKVVGAIPEGEYQFLEQLVLETTGDIARYNTSFAGMLSNMSNEATGLDNQINSILESIQNKEGLEELAAIKNVVGTD